MSLLFVRTAGPPSRDDIGPSIVILLCLDASLLILLVFFSVCLFSVLLFLFSVLFSFWFRSCSLFVRVCLVCLGAVADLVVGLSKLSWAVLLFLVVLGVVL